MHAQAPTTTISRGPAHALLALFAALAVAGGTVGIVALTNDDGATVSSPSQAISNVAPDRVLDGSPILRGTAVVRTPSSTQSRVLDGSPILRGHALVRTPSSTQSRVLDGSPILRGHDAAKAVTHESSVQGTSRSPEARPMGFGYTP